MAERLKQALDRARAERDAALRSSDGASPLAADGASPVRRRNEPPALPIRLGTLIGHVLPVDADHLRRERVLPPQLQTPPGPQGTAALQAYKILRTQVLQRMDAHHWNTLAVMSPMSGDGKTLTAINLAITIAADPGRSAVLVDFDLRRPTIAQRFGFASDQFVGVEDVLQAERSLEQACIRPQGYERLVVLNAASAVTGSSELLNSAVTRRIMSELRGGEAGRMIIVDLPPLLGGDDALAFAPQVDAVLLVISGNHTRSADVLRSFELLRDKPVVGTLLNRATALSTGEYPY